MTPLNTDADVYAVTTRLIRLRNVLRHGPHDVHAIQTQLPNDYADNANSKKQLRRDLHNLEALGYVVKRQLRPLRWSIEASVHVLSDEDVRAFIHIREAFSDNHPLAPLVMELIARLTAHLSDSQRILWRRQPALRVPLHPAIDYRDCAELIQQLEKAITQRQQITFLYRARGQPEPLRHERLDPYEIEYTDRHFYLIAFSYRYGSIITFRIDRIVQDKQQDSPRILPGMQQLSTPTYN